MNDLSQVNTALSQRFALHLFAINNNIEPSKVALLWQNIATRYNETQRAYHTLDHLQQLFVQFEQIKPHLHNPHIIALALYYHDVIYDPARLDNELKSAEYAVKALSPCLDIDICQHIYALIMMTATHQLDEFADHDKCSDAAYLLDMDLSILGALWAEYELYAKAIRQEYAHVSDVDYRAGRVGVLQELLARPTLYLTDYYYKQLEKRALDNIKYEITLLAS